MLVSITINLLSYKLQNEEEEIMKSESRISTHVAQVKELS